MPPALKRTTDEIAREMNSEAEKVAAPAAEPTVRQSGQIRRVSRQDIDEMRDWLTRRMARRYPRSTTQQLLWLLTSSLAANECWFVRNDVAIGLAIVTRDPLMFAKVEEQFVFALGYEGRGTGEVEVEDLEAEDAALTLYPHLVEWSRGREASRAALLMCSDASEAAVRKVVPGLKSGSFCMVMLG